WVCGEGRYTEKVPPVSSLAVPGLQVRDGIPPVGTPAALEAASVQRRCAICIGPEYGTVGPQLVKEAAKEAVKGVGFDLLLVCGFAFDPHVAEEAKRYGKLKVLPV